MNLTQEQIEKLSKQLNKIEIQDHKLWDDINNTLTYIDLLQEVDTTGITPTNSVIQKENTLREDALQEKPLSRERLLACSKQSVIQKQITIPNIM